MEIESRQQMTERRKEIEQELVEMLKKTENDFTFFLRSKKNTKKRGLCLAFLCVPVVDFSLFFVG